MITDEELIAKAKEFAVKREPFHDVAIAKYGCALVTDKGNIYTGVSVDVPCNIGFCSEHNAIGSMLTGGESRIMAIVAVKHTGKILPPCGRCREFMNQVNPENKQTRVLLPEGIVKTIAELLPNPWR